jgi:putative hydrolase of the HAD superfamily
VPPPLDAVILDLGGVLMREPTAAHLSALGGLCGLDDAAFAAAWLGEDRNAYDAGALTAAEYWSSLGISDPDRLERVLAADADAWSSPNDPLVVWPGALREAGLRVGILSNMPREQWQRLGPRYAQWLEGCDEVTLSFEVGVTKPDEAIYRHCLTRLGVEPRRTLFVDDRHENVAAAGALGIQAIRYAGLDGLRAELAERFDGCAPLP